MIISVLNTKGGVGKSTVAINLAAAWAASGYDTLLIDTDEEGTSLAWYGRREEGESNLTVIALPEPQALKRSIRALVEKYDVIVIDGAPHLRELLTASAWLSNLVLVPIKPSPNDIWKLGPMIERLRDVQAMRADGSRAGPDVCFVVNEYVERTRLSREVETALEVYGLPILESRLAARMDYRDSFNQGSVALSSGNQKARREVEELLAEVQHRLGVEVGRVVR